jgi:predicted flap endonuclease-1-like 5' DNA nuclease
MNYKIQDIEGIGPRYGEKLAAVGITHTEKLLEQCAAAKGRREVAAKTGLDESQLLKWVNHADLMRISGIGKQFAELLEAAGVDTVKELRTRRADNLTAKMAEVNKARKLTRATPSERRVTSWIAQAKALQPLVSH